MEALHEKKIRFLGEMANTLRQEVIRIVAHAGSGHQGGPLGSADIFATLYFHILNHNPKKPAWHERDRLIVSCGHYCPVQYAALAHAGYFPLEELMTLRQINSRLQGHPHRNSPPGIETTSGPLGSGLSQAIGMALAARLDRKRNRIYCFMSDGEQEEGNTWEAVMCAAKYRLTNLTAIIDSNNMQIDGNVSDVMPLGSLRAKYESFGWHALEIDGHNPEELADAIAEAHAIHEGPTAVIAHTIPGKGVSFMENNYLWHSRPFKPGEAELALAELKAEGERIRKRF